MSIKHIHIFKKPFFILSLILACIGLLNLYSATSNFEAQGFNPLFVAQLFFTIFGVLVALLVTKISLRTLHASSYLIYLLSLFLLVLVLVMGSEVHGSLSWLDLGFVRLQPSEFGKLGLIFVLSRYFTHLQRERSLTLVELILPFLLFLIPAGLVAAQNDMGSSLFYCLVFATLVLAQGVRFKIILISLLLAVVACLVLYHFVLQSYQKDRIVSFMNPERDSRGSGYHLVQSKIAVGSSGFFGKGYTKGQSHKLKFLPERHTDFIFPVFLEEWGFFGGLVVLGFYVGFLISGLQIAHHAENRFGFFMGVGIVGLFFWHLVINVGGVLGLIPLTGVTLPFFSYGGSSLIANWVLIGVLMTIEKKK